MDTPLARYCLDALASNQMYSNDMSNRTRFFMTKGTLVAHCVRHQPMISHSHRIEYFVYIQLPNILKRQLEWIATVLTRSPRESKNEYDVE